MGLGNYIDASYLLSVRKERLIYESGWIASMKAIFHWSESDWRNPQ